jgi:hypothetical protein
MGGLGGLEPVLYKLPELIDGIENGLWIVIVEGEKDVHTLQAAGLVATTNPMGAGKWRPTYTEALVGAPVAIVPDNDTPGIDHANSVAAALDAKGIEVRIVTLDDLPPTGDVTDWLSSGHTSSELKELIRSAPVWEPSDEAVVNAEFDSSKASNPSTSPHSTTPSPTMSSSSNRSSPTADAPKSMPKQETARACSPSTSQRA